MELCWTAKAAVLSPAVDTLALFTADVLAVIAVGRPTSPFSSIPSCFFAWLRWGVVAGKLYY